MPQMMTHRQLVRRVARWDRMDTRAIEGMRQAKIVAKADAVVEISAKAVTKAERDLRNLKKALRQ